MRLPAALLLALLAACSDHPAPLTLDRDSGLAVTGSPVVFHAAIDLACADWPPPTVGLASGDPLPAWLTVGLTPTCLDHGCFYLGNPGSGSPFDTGGAVAATEPAPRPDGLNGYVIALAAAPGAPLGPVQLRVAVSGCGRTGDATYRLQVVGDSGRAGMCGWSSGGACAGDGGCQRVGDSGLLCAETGAAPPGVEPRTQACADPVVTGASCGCAAGACAWH